MPVKTQIAQKILDEISSYLEQKDTLDSIVALDKAKDTKSIEHLSADKVEGFEGYMTLLSEGSVLYSDGTIRLYITKGTLKKWYDSIDSSYEGYVTTGHISLDSFPVRDGYFRKADLKIVTDKNGRSDLLVKPHVNTQLSNIKDLIIQDEPFAISSEFMWWDKEITDEDIEEYAKLVVYNMEHGGGVDVPITDNIEITGFSFVGNPGNAKSGGYEPSILVRNEEEHLKNKDILAKVLEQLSTQVAEQEVVEEVVETPVEATEEVVEKEEAVEEVVEEAEEVKVEETLAKATERIEALEADLANKTTKIAELEAELAEYKASESTVNEQLTKLEKLLTKSNPTVETQGEEKKEEPFSHFGRKRFGGQ